MMNKSVAAKDTFSALNAQHRRIRHMACEHCANPITSRISATFPSPMIAPTLEGRSFSWISRLRTSVSSLSPSVPVADCDTSDTSIGNSRWRSSGPCKRREVGKIGRALNSIARYGMRFQVRLRFFQCQQCQRGCDHRIVFHPLPVPDPAAVGILLGDQPG